MDVSSTVAELEGSYEVRGAARRYVLWGLLPLCLISPFAIMGALLSEATISPGEFVGVITINVIAWGLWLSGRRVKKIEISKDWIQFDPVGTCIPVSEIKEINLSQQHGGAIKVSLKVLSADTKLYIGALMWAGEDVTFWIRPKKRQD